MNKIIAFTTDVALTARIVEGFSDSINRHIKGWKAETIHIKEYLKYGIPKTYQQ